MLKRVKEEKDYNNYNVDGNVTQPIKKSHGDVQDITPCYACTQGLGVDSSGLWKTIDDMIADTVFVSGTDFTAQQIYDEINAHRLQHSSEEDIMINPFTLEDVKKHMNKHSSNVYWKTKKSEENTSELLEKVSKDDDGMFKALSKEDRDTYTKLTDIHLKTLDRIENLKKARTNAEGSKTS